MWNRNRIAFDKVRAIELPYFGVEEFFQIDNSNCGNFIQCVWLNTKARAGHLQRADCNRFESYL